MENEKLNKNHNKNKLPLEIHLEELKNKNEILNNYKKKNIDLASEYLEKFKNYIELNPDDSYVLEFSNEENMPVEYKKTAIAEELIWKDTDDLQSYVEKIYKEKINGDKPDNIRPNHIRYSRIDQIYGPNENIYTIRNIIMSIMTSINGILFSLLGAIIIASAINTMLPGKEINVTNIKDSIYLNYINIVYILIVLMVVNYIPSIILRLYESQGYIKNYFRVLTDYALKNKDTTIEKIIQIEENYRIPSITKVIRLSNIFYIIFLDIISAPLVILSFINEKFVCKLKLNKYVNILNFNRYRDNKKEVLEKLKIACNSGEYSILLRVLQEQSMLKLIWFIILTLKFIFGIGSNIPIAIWIIVLLIMYILIIANKIKFESYSVSTYFKFNSNTW